jgi:prepilin-type N-terminal cleavage/methylation domain-containing protein
MVKITKNQKAFTLAEVLITLLIIGVVASIVVPNLIADTQQAEFITAWKKTYGVISQAQLNMVREYGSVTGAFSNIEYSSDGRNSFMNGWLPYLAVTKKCTGARIIHDGCHTINFQALNGATIPNYNSIGAGVILNDGTLINFYSGVCTGNLCTDSNLFIDVNGAKKPNIVGKDVFRMEYRPAKDRFIPGIDGDTCTGPGWDCGAYYLFH